MATPCTALAPFMACEGYIGTPYEAYLLKIKTAQDDHPLYRGMSLNLILIRVGLIITYEYDW